MSEDKRTIKEVYGRLVSNPFFPLLFISEAIKTASVEFVNLEPFVVYALLGVVATVLWAVSDMVDVDVQREGTFWK